MRKQTKLVAVLSAASLLAIGASMTSFAKGWTEENGEWVYLDSDGERVTQEWKKSGSNYYWLDENGVMATSQIVDDDDNTYYVNEYGVRAKNQWISVENEDDADVNGEEVDTLWYYFGDNGKAYKADSNDLKKKTCPDATGSRTYFFDSEGHMVSDWVDYDGATYYCGTENEGWAYTGWQYLEPDDDLSSEDYDDQEWFNFKSSGKMRKSATWYSKGRYYTFDANGIMTSDWYDLTVTTPSNNVATGTHADALYTSENGSKGTGWVYTENPSESDSYWYYLVSFTDNNGTIRNLPFNSQSGDSNWRAKVIKSKTYIFNEKGEMQDGLVKLGIDADSPNNLVYANGKLVGDTKGGAISKPLPNGVYYFNESDGSSNGQMVTGKTTVTKDGEDYYYYFDKTTGCAINNEVKDGVVYGPDAERIDAEDGNNNWIYDVTEDITYNKSKATADDTATGTKVIKAGSRIIVSASGKLRTSGTVKVDGVKYKVVPASNYVDNASTPADETVWTVVQVDED